IRVSFVVDRGRSGASRSGPIPSRDSAILRARTRTPSDIDQRDVDEGAAMNDLTGMASATGARLKAQKQTVAVAESSAGGLISAALLAIPGASAYFLGGGVIYTQVARRGLLRIPDEAMRGVR